MTFFAACNRFTDDEDDDDDHGDHGDDSGGGDGGARPQPLDMLYDETREQSVEIDIDKDRLGRSTVKTREHLKMNILINFFEQDKRR
ncbi:MAG: hypothetical protein Q9157_006948 [Trypethelium eluteriae]